MIRFGIVGFGLHAVKRLMPGFELAKNCHVTALSRRDLVRAQESAKQFNIPYAFASVEDLCRSTHVDAVLVTTPNSSHLSDVLTAIACRKPVLCEKPLGMNAGECRQMVEAAHKANVLFGVAHVFRFETSTIRLRERLAASEIGKPIHARSEFSFYVRSDHPRQWMNNRSIAGGGPIADVGVHCIDTLRYILDDEVVRVSARATTDALSGDVEASGALILEFARGTLGSVVVSFRTDYRTPLEIVGGSGALRAEDALNVEHPITLQLLRGGAVVDTETVSNHRAYAIQVDEFAAAVEGRSKFPAPGEEGWQNQEVLDAAYRSIVSGKVEDVPRVPKEKAQ
jgi:predicted dehydrogenase